MRKIIFTYLLVIAILQNLFCQTANWMKFDSLLKGAVNSMFYDSIDHAYYFGGRFYGIESDTIYGIGKYKNGTWQRLGEGVDWNKSSPFDPNTIANPVTDIIKYNDTIYIIGSFSFSGQNILNGIAKWNGSDWVSIGQGLEFYENGNYSSGSGKKFRIINNELYVLGGFDRINRVIANGVAKFNGTSWQPVYNFPVFYPSLVNIPEDVIMFQNELFIVGTFSDNSTVFGLVKWNGNAWVNPGAGVYGYSTVLGGFVFKNELYIIGTWSKYNNSNNIGNGIMKFNGQSWMPVSEGSLFYPYNVAGIKTYAYNPDYLFLGGNFDTFNNTKGIYNVVRFDGNYWCSVDSTFNTGTGIESMMYVNDTLFISGELMGTQFGTCGIAFCKNINYTDKCSADMTGIKKSFEFSNIELFPNPVENKLNIRTTSIHTPNTKVEIHNNLGQLMYQQSFSYEIDISSWKSGFYYISIITNGQSVYRNKFLKI